MERNQFNIDRLLRSKLSRPAAGPDEEARNNMEQMLRDAARENRRKKRGFWWFFVLIGICGLSWGIWSNYLNSEPAPGERTEITKTNDEAERVQKENSPEKFQPDKSSSEKNEKLNFESSPKNETSKGSQASTKVEMTTKSNRDNNKTLARLKPLNGRNTEPEKLNINHNNSNLEGDHAAGNKDIHQSGLAEDINNNNPVFDETSGKTENDLREKSEVKEPEIDVVEKAEVLNLHSDTVVADSAFISQIIVDSIIKPEPSNKRYWEATAGLAWSRFNTIKGNYFALNDRETIQSISGLSPDFAVRRNFNRLKVGVGFSTFQFNHSINDDSLRVADGEVIVVDGEFATIEYYDTELDENLRKYAAVTSFSSKNFRLQAGYDLCKKGRIQISPVIGLEYQSSRYEELSYHRIGFYILVEDTDPPVDYYTIWHEKKRTTYSNWMINGLASIEISAMIGRNILLSFEPMVHYPLKSDNTAYPKTVRLDAKLAVGFRLYK